MSTLYEQLHLMNSGYYYLLVYEVQCQSYLIAENDLNVVIMLGFGNLKDKIANLSEGLKSQFSTEIEPTEVESNLKSQSHILSRYQVRL